MSAQPQSSSPSRFLDTRYWPVEQRSPCRGAACPVRTSNASGFCSWCRGRIEEEGR